MEDNCTALTLSPSQLHCMLVSERLSPELRQALIRSQIAILQTQNSIHRSDQLIRCLAKVFVGNPPD